MFLSPTIEIEVGITIIKLKNKLESYDSIIKVTAPYKSFIISNINKVSSESIVLREFKTTNIFPVYKNNKKSSS